jgi:hypothetical protein
MEGYEEEDHECSSKYITPNRLEASRCYAVAHLVEAMPKVAGSIPYDVIGIFH